MRWAMAATAVGMGRARSLAALLLLAAGALATAQGTGPSAKPVLTAPPARAPGAADAPPAATAPWFDTIRGPAGLDAETAARFAAELLAALHRGPSRAAPALEFLPADNAPRVVLLAWRRAGQDAVLCAGTGIGLRAAADDALAKARALPGAGTATGLLVELVEHAVQNRAFIIREDALPHPDLVGIAFSRDSAFFFPPDLLTGRGLLRETGHLAVNRVGEALLAAGETTRLGHWQMISSYQAAQEVSFFEVLSLHATPERVVPLFRGHPLPEPAGEAQLRQAGTAAAAFLQRHIRPDGAFACALPDWRLPDSGAEAPAALAATALALLEWHAAAPAADTLAAGTRLLRRLVAELRPTPGVPQARCVPELDRTTLGTNALLTLALARHRLLTRSDEFNAALHGLGRHLLAQRQPDGTFACVRALPSGTVRGELSLTAQAQAVAALVRLYEATGLVDYLDAGEQALLSLAAQELAARDMERLPQDGWLLAALDEAFTFRRQDEFLRQAERLGLALFATQVLDPLFPDFLGNWRNGPRLADAAIPSYGLFRAARLLRDRRHTESARNTLAAAHLGLLFQLQGQVDEVSGLFLPDAEARRGAFRDDLLGNRSGCRLAQQADTLLALAEAVRLSARLQGVPLPLTERMREALAASRQAAATFPRCLPRRLE
jgi:hypothetical protein